MQGSRDNLHAHGDEASDGGLISLEEKKEETPKQPPKSTATFLQELAQLQGPDASGQ